MFQVGFKMFKNCFKLYHMDTLLVLVFIQLSGVILSVIVSCCIQHIDKKKIVITGRASHIAKTADMDWLIEYFQYHPESDLRFLFPQFFKLSKAVKRYNEINSLIEAKLISQKKYEKELNKILTLVDIKSDVGLLQT